MGETFYITTPIYYVNDVPHIGHAYTTVAADVAARYHRLKGEDTYFLTGTDEHGGKVAATAAEKGMEPQAWTDQISQRFREVWPRLDISNDDFIRTTEERHIKPVQAFLQHLYDKGEIYEGEYEGPYCQSCEAFYKESELVDGGCPVHKRPVERLKERNYFFRLSAHAGWLLNEYYAQNPCPVQPDSRLNECVSFIKSGLQDVSISRPSLEWGIPLPWNPEHVIYVWIEALQNYITALGYPDGDKFKRYWPAVHLVGKEIVRFHAVIWPAMLHAAGVEPPKMIFGHGWLLVGGEKMSKTNLTGIHPFELVDAFGVDAYRYYFLREVAFGQDGNFSWESMEARYTSELANGIGNLASRVVAMIGAYFDAAVPAPSAPETDQDATLREVCEASVRDYTTAMDALAFHQALEAVDKIVRRANGYIVETAPWVIAKDPTQRDRLARVLFSSAETLRILAVLLSPFMPGACERLWGMLGSSSPLSHQVLPAAGEWGGLRPGSATHKGESLFPRLEQK
ncbi:MAG TPA: methionine--tRNA ligase [Actinomycetota bacterium]|nr:methionine--tRNA ligase [Actinomycetota bacterium]